jgi:predicted nucleotidyltransferase component of viral defense system
MGEGMESMSDGVALTGDGQKIWEILFSRALRLIDSIYEHGSKDAFWTFGGGTALMLRYNHRISKDIDIFVPDPQSFGYVSPRLSEVAESMTTEYIEAAGYIKLFFEEGEIDFVASPNLTIPGYEVQAIMGREVRVETPVEIIAKKMWHRGDHITGRDIFDFAVVAKHQPDSILLESSFMTRHGDALLRQLDERSVPLRIQYEAVESLGTPVSFDEACETVRKMLAVMRGEEDVG